MLRDDDMFPMPISISSSEDDMVRDVPNHYDNDDLDDVWGSEPGSPGAEDDERDGNGEQSDIPRLKEKHETEGYRDGVTKGKAENVQVGFDEGYGLGAVLGLKIGRILGLVEGIYAGVMSAEGEEWREEKARLEGLYGKAKEELRTECVFGREWWGEDAIWKYEVPGEQEGREVVFPDVAAAHPLIFKWEKIVDEEVARWGLDLGVMDHEHVDGEDEETHISKAKKTEGKEIAAEVVASEGTFMGISKKELNW